MFTKKHAGLFTAAAALAFLASAAARADEFNPNGTWTAKQYTDIYGKKHTNTTLHISWDPNTKTGGGDWDKFPILTNPENKMRVEGGIAYWYHKQDGKFYSVTATGDNDHLNVSYKVWAVDGDGDLGAYLGESTATLTKE